MAGAIFNRSPTGSAQPSVQSIVRQVRSMGAPKAVFQQLMNTNPAFAQFVSVNRGKNIAQIAAEHGVDVEALRAML